MAEPRPRQAPEGSPEARAGAARRHVPQGPRQSLRRQLVWSVALVHAVLMLGFIGDLTWRDHRRIRDAQRHHAEMHAVSLAAAVLPSVLARDLAGLGQVVAAMRSDGELAQAMVLDVEGSILAHTEAARVGQRVAGLPPLAGAGGPVILNDSETGADVMAPVISDGKLRGWVRIGLAPDAARAALNGALLRGLLYALAAIGAGAVVAAWLALRVTRRLAVVQAAADAVRSGNLAQRSRLAGDDEPARLSRAFDSMLDAQSTALRALAESEARNRLALDAAQLGAWRWGIGNAHTDWLSDRQLLLGPEPPDGWPDFRQMVLDEDREAYLEAARRVLRGETSAYESRFRLRRTDGRIVTLVAHGRLLRDDGGLPAAIIGVTRDVTVEAEAAGRLAASEAFAQRLFDANPDALLLVDASGTIRRANARAQSLFGVAELAGRAIEELVPTAARERHRGLRMALDARLEPGQSYRTLAMRALGAGGAELPVRVTLGAVVQAGERLVIVSVHDMSAENALRDELLRHREHLEELVRQRTADFEQARSRAEHLSRAKSDFLAHMSHEVRTPLNAMLGMAQLGRQASTADPDRQRYAEIVRAGEHLLSIVNDVLDVARVEAGQMTLVRAPLALQRLLCDTTEWYRAQAAEKGLALECSIAPSVPEWAMGDERRLRQILANLLANAIKFTDTGSVQLRAAAESGWLHLRVQDSGPGLDADMVARLFQPFAQADDSLTRRFGGSGLGLSISQGLARLMGGEITVDTSPGAGSAFTLSLPVEPCDEPRTAHARSTPEARLAGCRLLVVDDVEINRVVAEAMLQQAGAEVLLACDGQQALDIVAAQPVGTLHAVLMDVQMPGMDGLEATRRLAQQAPGLPVIALTAFAMDDERLRFAEAGMVAQLTKPVAMDELERVVLDVVRGRLARAGPTRA